MTVKQHDAGDSRDSAGSVAPATDAPDGAVRAAEASGAPEPRPLTDVERGIVVGILIGEGHFGGDGRYPHITLRMHTRHEPLFRWLLELFPRTRLYGPYHHGGRHYFQWMARGGALVNDVLPVVEDILTEEIDARTAERLRDMKTRYAAFFAKHD